MHVRTMMRVILLAASIVLASCGAIVEHRARATFAGMNMCPDTVVATPRPDMAARSFLRPPASPAASEG